MYCEDKEKYTYMKTAKSYKLFLLITAFVMLTMAFLTMSFGVAKADTVVSPSNYFEYGENVTAKFEYNNAVFTLKESATIKIKKEIVVNDFLADLKLGTGIESVKVVISTDSYFVNGNEKDGKFDKTIKNTATVTATGIVKMKVDANGYYAINGGTPVSDKYYRVPVSNEYNLLTGNVEFEVKLAENTTEAKFEIVSLSQKGLDDSYLLNFVLTDGALTEAKPLVSIDDSMKVINDGGDNKVVMTDEKRSTINYTVHSFLGGVIKSETKITAENGWVNEEKNNGEVHFTTSTTEFKIVDKTDATKIYATVKVKVLDHTVENKEKPIYVDNADAIKAFTKALEEQYIVIDDKGTDDVSDDTSHCVPLGTKIKIPSLKDLVSDNYTAYENLTQKLYYATPTATSFSNSTSMELTLSSAGKYTFFVVFTDENGNEMEKAQFITEEEGKEDVLNNNEYGKFVFSIYVKDDAPITITPATVQGKGYKGASYTASKFTVDATGCTVTYKLYYNANSDAKADAEGWVEIPSSSSITDTDYNENGYSYSDVQSIAYNGSLTFVPNKIGSYKIVCTASSKTTAREESASTIIKIENEPAVVKPASEWLQNNVWSVVFLSVGTLCLIGIIVLLFIKPKEENDNE